MATGIAAIKAPAMISPQKNTSPRIKSIEKLRAQFDGADKATSTIASASSAPELVSFALLLVR